MLTNREFHLQTGNLAYKTGFSFTKRESWVTKGILGLLFTVEALVSGVTDKYKLFIVVESIADVYKLCKETGMIDKITLGGVKSREGTRQISKAVFTTPKEEELLKELITDGVTVEMRQVPSDSVIYAKDVL